MISCQMMAQISQALSDAKGHTDIAFGGVSVVFAGDFAQLPPVAQTKLYSPANVNKCRDSQSSRAQQEIFGKLLWLTITTVVMLTKPMCQCGAENQPFVELLDRLRAGECTNNNYTVLSQKAIVNAVASANSELWIDAPIIVYDNATNDALNIEAVKQFATKTGREFHWYYALDKYANKELCKPSLRTKVQNKHSGSTNQRLGKVPLVLGMRVMVAQNFDVNGGIVNGSIGTLKGIRYSLNRFGQRVLESCIVHLPDSTALPINGLPDGHFPIIADVTDMSGRAKYSGGCSVIKCWQVPIQPAYAFMCHRAQGQTYCSVIVDL